MILKELLPLGAQKDLGGGKKIEEGSCDVSFLWKMRIPDSESVLWWEKWDETSPLSIQQPLWGQISLTSCFLAHE